MNNEQSFFQVVYHEVQDWHAFWEYCSKSNPICQSN